MSNQKYILFGDNIIDDVGIRIFEMNKKYEVNSTFIYDDEVSYRITGEDGYDLILPKHNNKIKFEVITEEE